MTDNRNDLSKILKQRRRMIPLTLNELAAKSGVSVSHLGRIERGERFPSAYILRRIAKPLGFDEDELFVLAGFLSPQPLEAVEKPLEGQLDPYVVSILSQEPGETQHAVFAILTILKSIAKAYQCNVDFAEYIHRKYPQVDEDIITMVKDILEHPLGGT